MTAGAETSAQQRRRVVWLAVVFIGLALILVGRLVWWQLLPRPEISNAGIILDPGATSNIIPAARGNILDAGGNYLAASTVEYKIAVSPSLLTDGQKEKLTPILAEILGQDPQAIASALARRDTEYVLLGAGFPARVGQQIEALDLDAFNLEISFRRVYPDESLAASILGFIDYQGIGRYGLEEYYDEALRGRDGVWRGVSDSWGEQILVSLGGYQPAQDGVDLILTLDRNIQYAAERILREGAIKNKATSGNLIVLDPKTGGVLAMANYPSYQPGVYWQVDSPEQYINTSISALYEPGSVFKPLTLVAALDARVILPTDTYDDRGEILVGQQRIMNWDRKPHGRTTMTQLLAHSYNVGAAHVATLLGPTRFYEVIRRFGFSEVTGIDLALEAAGIMRVPGNSYWHMSDLGTNSYGQGISVTPLQVAAAYGAMANDGLLMRPRIVSEVRGAQSVEVRRPIAVRQIVSPEAAQQITQLMADGVEISLKGPILPGYRFAAKSGTAGIPDAEGYQNEAVIASFVGYGPIPNPRFVILAKFDKPREGLWGTEVAAPEFAAMAKFLVDYYGIPPSR